MAMSSENILLLAVLTRELMHVEMMINREIKNEYSYDNLSTIKTYLNGRITEISA